MPLTETLHFFGPRGIAGLALAGILFFSVFFGAQFAGLVLAAHILNYDQDLWYVKDVPLGVALVVWLPLAAIAYPCNLYLYVQNWRARVHGEREWMLPLPEVDWEEADNDQVSAYMKAANGRVSRWMASIFTDEIVAIALFVLLSAIHSLARVYSWLRKAVRAVHRIVALFDSRRASERSSDDDDAADGPSG